MGYRSQKTSVEKEGDLWNTSWIPFLKVPAVRWWGMLYTSGSPVWCRPAASAALGLVGNAFALPSPGQKPVESETLGAGGSQPSVGFQTLRGC